MSGDIEQLVKTVIDAGLKLHIDLGPSLMESVYEAVFAVRLERLGMTVARQVPIKIEVDGLIFPEAFRADILIENALLVELKSVENLMPVHAKQVLTYLRLANLPIGLLMNFGADQFKDGLKRLVNNHVIDFR
ncbi:MAG TPA: GxxExxY protein [Sphingorhabdus sp.]|nr:GxxExxY protein [Sphingorhabdus sp.]